jgi:hypothetical protein
MTKCPFCDSEKEYKTIGNHWRQSCEYPTVSEFEYEVLSGLLAGDATVKSSKVGNTSIEIKMINKEFLNYVDKILGIKSTGVSKKYTSKEISENIRDSSPVSSECSFSDQYVVTTRNIPDLNPFSEWYDEGEKRIPDSKKLTSTMVKYWYVCDGGLSWNKESNSSRAQLTSTNESDRLSEIANVIGKKSGVRPSVYEDRIMFKPRETDDFLSWIGDAPRGFEYKFCNSSLNEYETKMQKVYGAR